MKFFLGSESSSEFATIKLPHSDANTTSTLATRLKSCLDKIPPHRSIVCVCIGTDRSTGDALGPLVGTKLQAAALSGFSLYGTLEEPVHALNLADTLERVHNDLLDPYIIGIDACLGQMSSVGCIQLGAGPLKPGAGVNKELPPVGDIHLTGIVNIGGFMEYFILQNTRLSLVMSMSEVIASAIRSAYQMSRRPSSYTDFSPAVLPFDR